jgi:tRNA 2-selenouridine synthase
VQGGYRALRRALRADLELLPGRLQFHVLCGRTGCGKSRLLRALRTAGAQVLDLEALAQHRGSVLGLEPGTQQPSQKLFESRLWAELHGFDPQRPVFVEAESKKIGVLHVPEALMEQMRIGRCVSLELDPALRVAFLLQDYAGLSADRALLQQRLDSLRALRGADVVAHWKNLIAQGNLSAFTAEILEQHYDPSYLRSMANHFRQFESSPRIQLSEIHDAAFAQAAAQVLDISCKSDARATFAGQHRTPTHTEAMSG